MRIRIILLILILIIISGLNIFFRGFGNIENILLLKKDKYYYLFKKIEIGMNKSDFIKLFGEPTKMSSDFKVTTSNFMSEKYKAQNAKVVEFYYYYGFPHRSYVIGFDSNKKVAYFLKSKT